VVVVLDKNPEESRETIELKASKEARQPAATGETLQDRLQSAIGGAALQTPERGGPEPGAEGATAAAGVLTAVDEDEDGEDAPVPEEFEYQTDGNEEEE
jgi:26S proteasome regulatory subunit N2